MAWFASWFDSPYYHLLYKNRNDEEAQQFMTALTQHLNLKEQTSILDLACGKGRHSIFLSSLGYNITGVDLSPESIAHARQFETPTLRFREHDMRANIDFGPFDYIFNLFTSFGYFNTKEEHIDTLKKMAEALKDKNSRLVIDFFNAHKVIQNLVLSEEKQVEGQTFYLNRRVENNYILKDIRFEDKGNTYVFQERVAAFKLEDFKEMLAAAGLQLFEYFGDFQLGTFDLETSPRLILIVGKC